MTLRDILEGHPPVDRIQWRSSPPKEWEDDGSLTYWEKVEWSSDRAYES